MKIFKKMITGVLALTTLFSVGVTSACGGLSFGSGSSESGQNSQSEQKTEQEAFIDGLGGVSETYVSEVSKTSYETTEKAAEAYVKEQIVGEKQVDIVNSTSKGALNETEIAALNIPEEDSKDVVSVEELEVEYSELAAIAPVSAAPANTKKIKVYIIKYPDCFKYYTPCPVTGETINKGYYDSVFNAEKYKNCTLETTNKMTMDLNGVTATSETSQIVKYTQGAIYLEQTTKTTGEVGGDMNIYAYITQAEGEITCWIKIQSSLLPSLSTDWTEGDLTTVGFGDLEEIVPFYDQYLDYTYFTKTDYGFALSDENAQAYVKQSIAEFESYLNSFTIDMFAEYYVCGGVLSGMRMDLGMTATVENSGQSATNTVTMTTETKVTGYGTTVVEKPF